MEDSDAYGISSATTPQGSGGKSVTVFFTNGTSKTFDKCTDIAEPSESLERQELHFTQNGVKFTFRKSQLAGWAY